MFTDIERLWRVFATALCFAVFGLGGIVCAIAVFPLMRLVCRDKLQREKTARYVVHRCFRMFVWLMKVLGIIKVEVVDEQSVRKRSGLLLIANHPTLIDVVLLLAHFPDMNCVVKKAIWSNVFMSETVKATGYISNDSPDKILEDCVDWVKSGGSLIIFPEGSRTRPGQPISLQRGAANIAVRSGKDLTVVIIHCNPVMLSKQSPWYRVPERRSHFRLVFRGELPVQTLLADAGGYPSAARRVTESIAEIFEQEVSGNEYSRS